MARVARHLLHYRSSLDGVEQPYLVSAPQDLSQNCRLPVILLLHDVLPDPSPGGFIEEGFRQTALWLEAMAEGPPALLVQPYGRGNAGWLGPGGRDILDICNRLHRQFPCEFAALGLVGFGAGATGALQLACWFPGWFAGVAAIGAWANDRHELPLDARDWPAWERPQRQALAPCALAANLAGTALHFEHPWWCHGLAATAGAHHTAALCRQLDALSIPYEYHEDPVLVQRRDCPTDRSRLWQWLTSRRRAGEFQHLQLVTYSLRLGRRGPIQLLRIKPGAAASVVGSHKDGAWRLSTKNVLELAVHLPVVSESGSLWLDRRSVPVPEARSEIAGGRRWVRLERLGTKWHAAEQAWEGPIWPGGAADPLWNSGATTAASGTSLLVKTPVLGGPAMDLRWDAVLFVYGTLGDERHCEVAQRLAEQLRRNWQTGADSLNPHPGDRTCAVDYAVVADTAVTDDQIAQCHLVLIGCPATNLLLARFRAGIACEWIQNADGITTAVVLNHETYDCPGDLVVFVHPNPQAVGKYLLVVTAVDPSGLAAAARLHTAFLPDFVAIRSGKVDDWGYFGPDWRLPNV